MTPQQIVALIVRLTSVYIGYLVFALATAAGFINYKEPVVPSVAFFAIEGALILVAALFWLFPMTVANTLISKTRETNVMQLPARQAAAAGAALIGLWALVNTVPQFTMLIVQAFYLQGYQGGAGAFGSSFIRMVAPALQLAICIFLLSRPWTVAEMIFPDVPRRAVEEENPD